MNLHMIACMDKPLFSGATNQYGQLDISDKNGHVKSSVTSCDDT